MEAAPDSAEQQLVKQIESLSNALIEEPDANYEMFVSHIHPVGARYLLELRAKASRLTGPCHQEEYDDNRYIYIFDKEEGCAFSFDLNHALATGENRGIYRSSVMHAVLIEAAAAEQPYRGFLESAIRQSKKARNKQPLRSQELAALSEQYSTFLDDASIITTRNRWWEFEGGDELEITRKTVEGNTAHLRYPIPGQEAALLVAVQHDRRATLYERNLLGEQETYTQNVNLLEELATIADEDQIERDNFGEIIFVEHSTMELATVRQVERTALGLSRLQLPHLQRIVGHLARVSNF